MSDARDKRERWGHEASMEIAERICSYMEPMCHKIQVAGSLRRGIKMVGDIEILYVPVIKERPKPGDMFATENYNYADEQIIGMEQAGMIDRRTNVNGQTMYGEKNKFMVWKDWDFRIPIDLFATTLENWWVSLVVRTGPKDFCLKLTTGANKKGLSLNAYGSGVTETLTNKVTPATSEEHVFSLCGVPYLPPEKRL